MTLKIPTLTALNTARIGSHSGDWKIGQITQGRVTDSNRANPSINIAGSNYQVTTSLQLAQGESLLLRVSAVSPQLEFAIISHTSRNVGNTAASAVTLQDKFLHNSPAANRNINASLSNLVGLLHESPSSPVPPAIALLINSLRSRIIRAGGLTNPKLIENSLLGSSLLIRRTSDTNIPNGGLLSLLKQIADSLGNQRSSIRRVPAGMKYQQGLGMMLYLNSDVDSLGRFTREVEEQYSNLANLRNRAQEDMQHHAYRLLAELPVLYRNQVESVSIRFFEKNREEKEEFDESDCGVDFKFEFGSGKICTKILIINSSVFLSVGCENGSTVEYLTTSINSLEERLYNYGLKLKEFRAEVHDGYLALDIDSTNAGNPNEAKQLLSHVLPTFAERTDEETRNQLLNAYAEGTIPALKEFVLRINTQEVGVTSEIPAQLYCAMACFFAQLFEQEMA